jgi:hypothetical protein
MRSRRYRQMQARRAVSGPLRICLIQSDFHGDGHTCGQRCYLYYKLLRNIFNSETNGGWGVRPPWTKIFRNISSLMMLPLSIPILSPIQEPRIEAYDGEQCSVSQPNRESGVVANR